MKKAAFILVLVLIASTIFWLLRRPGGTRPVPPAPESAPDVSVPPPPPASVQPPLPAEPTPPEEPASPAHAADPSPSVPIRATPAPINQSAAAQSTRQILETLRVFIRNYGLRFKGNPVGNNAEITAALTGKNPQEVNYLGDAPRLNDQGELVDGWGTPYFFHQLSGTDMEIHSAGPDRKMWTADDLVTR